MAVGVVSFVSLNRVHGLTSERALQRLEAADVVIPEGDRTSPSELVALALSGKRVARVTPGDALEFVGVLEEALAVARAGAPLESSPAWGRAVWRRPTRASWDGR